MIKIKCIDCGKERKIAYKTKMPKRCVTCSNKSRIGKRFSSEARQRMSEARMGEKNPQWKGGIAKGHSAGYIRICLNPSNFFYPMTGNQNYVFEHRLVMAQHLGRCLLPWEIIHHKNGIRGDNRIENLELFPSAKYHVVDSVVKAYIRKLEIKVKHLEDKLKESK